ncbi:MAG: site-specific integrase [Nocardioidaceae bacterium]|nr:site-specific integrase [Nocardioidaceae bacterium]
MAPKPERTKAGTWRVRFRHGTSSRTGRKLATSETFPTKKEALQFAAWLGALGPQGALDQLYAAEQQADVPTLDQVAADHIEHLTGIERGTRLSYQRLWSRTWSPLIGRTPANQVTADKVRAAVNHLGERYSRKSLENQRGLLAGVLARAVELAYLPKNPAKGIRLPRGQEAERTEMRLLTPAEFASVEDAMAEHYRPLIRFLIGTGARWGEAVALTVADVALPNVRIRRALKWSPDNVRTVGATKTRKSNRTVVVPLDLHDELRAACEGKAKADLVFTASRGGSVLHRTFWSRYWLPAVQHLEPRPRIHDLRHSHASWLLAAGVPIHVVQARLGHESIQTTVDTYGHLLPDAQLAASNAASAAFASAPKAITSPEDAP